MNSCSNHNTLSIGHRGAKGYVAENTYESISKAIQLGVDGIEIDVFKCASGELVLFHDKNLKELTGESGLIENLTIKELEQFISFWIETIVVTSSDPNLYNEFAKKENFNIQTMYADATVLKTIIRSNPGFFLMKNGIVRGKWHYNKIPNPQEVLKSAGYKL